MRMTAKLGTRRRKRLKDRLLARDGPWCTWCCRVLLDEPIEPEKDPRISLHMTIEHLIPVVLGGTNDLVNLALACFQCNNARGCQDIDFVPSWAVGSIHDDVDEAHRGESCR